MLPPHELKKTDFTRVVRGYNAAEVDEHLDFVIEKYTELYRENDALEQKLRTVTSRLEVLKKDEEAIRGALMNAQRAGAAIVAEANERADVVMHASKTNCDKILSDFRAAIRTERAELVALREGVSRYKAQLFAMYQQHIEYIAALPTEADEIPSEVPTEEQLVSDVIDDIKSDITENLIRGNGAVTEDAEKTAPAAPAPTTEPTPAESVPTADGDGKVVAPAVGTDEEGGEAIQHGQTAVSAELEAEPDVTVGRRPIDPIFGGGAEPHGTASADVDALDAEIGGELTPEASHEAKEDSVVIPKAAKKENAPTLKKEASSGIPEVKESGIMASLNRTQKDMKSGKMQVRPARPQDKKREADDQYDRDLQEFLESMDYDDSDNTH